MVFYGYAPPDHPHAERLRISLTVLVRQGLVQTWSESAMEPGAPRSQAVIEQLDAADLVLFLVSPDFLYCNFCYELQLKRALRNHHARRQVVVPLVVRPCDWRYTELGDLQALPRDELMQTRPVSQWRDSDLAWQSVADGIRQIVQSHFGASALTEPPSGANALKASDGRRLVRWGFAFSGTVRENDLPMIRTLAEHLRELSGDSRMTLLRVEQGSVRLVFLGTRAGFQRIWNLHAERSLEQRLRGLLPGRIEAIDWENDVFDDPLLEVQSHAAPSMAAAEQLQKLARDSGFEIVDEAELPGRPAIRSRALENLHPAVRELLDRLHPEGIYSHQAKGLRAILAKRDVCMATPTASGKSMVFIAAAADRLKRDPTARVLALYPAKALIQDQLDKWTRFLGPLGMAPGYIDGAVPVADRFALLRKHRVLLMTPDVTHAWLMSNLSKNEVADFVTHLRLLILDETHVYDGVFGTNMAYFLRRLLAVSGVESIVSSTATIGEPGRFVELLTGRRPVVVGESDDGSVRRRKEIVVTRPESATYFDQLVNLLVKIVSAGLPRFLAFADSRKMVEQVVAIAERRATKPDAGEGTSDARDEAPTSAPGDALGRLRILPYRAGYEEEDRRAIQQSLAAGRLAGVVSTSALELGLDIGEIGIVLLLGSPPSVKSFWQRVGRAGRAGESVCLVVDADGLMTSSARGLQAYLERPAEPGWLYLDNKFIQYAHALCAASELAQVGADGYTKRPFDSLPPAFMKLLENEINPTEAVPGELYPLKQRAQGGPQHEFPLRTGIEKNFSVKENQPPNAPRGTLALSQALREAYPGAIHYYMARPFRVSRFNYRTGEIGLDREKHGTTRPDSQSMVFPKLPTGVLSALRSDAGFVVETELQVSERVLGFTEQHGARKTTHPYGPGSPYAQQPIARFFETTGVCWYFRDRTVLTDAVAEQVLLGFCAVCGIQERDVGVAMFHGKPSALWPEQCQGICIYDAVDGSLRLTSQLVQRFTEVIREAMQLAKAQERPNTSLETALAALEGYVTSAAPWTLAPGGGAEPPAGDWVTVVAPHQRAIYTSESGPQEVEVLTYRYTPSGLMYQLVPQHSELKNWTVAAQMITPIHGVTELVEVNLITGETRPPREPRG